MSVEVRTPDGVTLDRMLEVHADRGDWLPLAVAHSVALDLLQSTAPDPSERTLDIAEVTIEPSGVARAEGAVGFRGVLPVITLMLGADGSGGLPPHACGLLALLEELSAEGAEDDGIERLRWALEEELPPPADRGEVAALAEELTLPTPEPMDHDSELPTLPPEVSPPRAARRRRPAASEAEPHSSQGRLLGGSNYTAGAYDTPPSPPEEAMAQAAGSLVTGLAREGSARGTPERPVVRHEVPRTDPPVSVDRAPAARRSAQAAIHGDDSILGPGEDRGWWVWLIVLAGVAGAVYLLFWG